MITIKYVLLFLSLSFFVQAQAPIQSPNVDSKEKKRVSLDRSLEPSVSEEISSLFENVVAVQRKAKVKSGKFLFAPYLSFDFSDSPQTMYAMNLNLGYAAGEFWEIYFNYVPSYINNERSIAKKVRLLPAYPDGTVPFLYVEKAKNSYGIEVNWTPVYGKDSWGPYGIIRSDTFLNIGISRINYEVHSAYKTKLAMGKTFFLSDYWNLRLQAGGSFLETYNQEKKEMIVIGLLEGGFVYYF
ncbi:MAG: hypothetical protein JNL11_16785 [Bdellovibrionaceae bacterium]|nr:hypothetical protein [Pseudobdellovibrionaceae bacterium]